MRSFYVLDPGFSCRLLDFYFCSKNHTTASSFFTQDCSRPPNTCNSWWFYAVRVGGIEKMKDLQWAFGQL
ncbi:hypothetical protein Peur_025216 [Populus x canadensis]